MLELEPYLGFNGDCEEALHFYARVFGGEVGPISRFKEAPPSPEMQLPPDWGEKIMHANFKAAKIAFMASDQPPGHEGGEGSRITLALGGDDVGEGERIFDALAEGGSVLTPYRKMFWGANFGMLTDKYGIKWMVNITGARP